jgi:hypothetical protein
MGREVKRVPLDFDWTIGKIWSGYLIRTCPVDPRNHEDEHDWDCEGCRAFAKIKGFAVDESGCPDYSEFEEVPKGDGYQLWETVSEGSPQSPVFKTAEELAAYCEKHCTTFGSIKASKDEWLAMINDDYIEHREIAVDKTTGKSISISFI